MAGDIEINQLPLLTGLKNTDVIPISRGDSFTKKSKINDIAIITGEYPYEAGEQITTLMALSVINGKAYKFDKNNEAHYGKCIGIATQSVMTGETVNVIKEGKYENSGFNLIPDTQYYINDLSELTDIEPITGIAQPIGIALATNTILVKIDDPTILI